MNLCLESCLPDGGILVGGERWALPLATRHGTPSESGTEHAGYGLPEKLPRVTAPPFQ